MDAFIGEIRPISFGYAPRGWAYCNGQLLPISQNQALFSLLGTQYGGNGITTFALPDLRGRVPVGSGQGPGLSNYAIGQTGGAETVALTTAQLPPHTHPLTGTLKTASEAVETNPAGMYPAVGTGTAFSANAATVAMASAVQGTTANAGSNAGHENRAPLLGISYIICIAGYFPSRN
jgi:microcystin-dependent protein